MEIRNFCKRLRYSLKPLSSKFVIFHSLLPPISSTAPSNLYIHSSCFHSSDSLNSLSSSTGCSSVCATNYPFANSSVSLQIHDGGICDVDDGYICLKLDLHRPHTRRHFSSYLGSFDRHTPFETSKQVSEIIDLVRADVNDLGSELDRMNVTLSISSSVGIFQILSRERVSALRFFDWLKASHPDLCYHPQICSLVIDNCGRLENYEALVAILREFNLKSIQLGQKTFGFLGDLSLDKVSVMEYTKRIMGVLYEVGGSCKISGVQSLIEMFCVSGSFDIAEFVIRTAGRKVNHYNILIREMCRRSDCERACNLLKVMKQNGCDPNRTSYNLVISCLCMNEKFGEACQTLEDMEKDYVLPDASTFDILVNFLCKRGQFDLASAFLDKMILKGIEPSISTHAAIIKAYFRSQKYEEAHEFVVDSAIKQRYSSNANYSLLATLHLKKGNVLLALKILHEMMDMGLKPNFRVYMMISMRLEKLNRKVMLSELKIRYSTFIEK